MQPQMSFSWTSKHFVDDIETFIMHTIGSEPKENKSISLKSEKMFDEIV